MSALAEVRDDAVAVPRSHRVCHVRSETAETVSLRVTPIDGDAAPFTPGQFSMVYAPGVGEIPLSMSGDPTDPRTTTFTVRGVGAVSRALAAARVGDLVGVRGPYGSGWPLADASGADVLVVAGGIGLAPLRPAILAILARRHRFARVAVVLGARTPDHLLFVRDVQEWRSRFDVHLEVTVDRAAPAWHGDVGFVTDLLGRVPIDPGSTTALVCGPEAMMRRVAPMLTDMGMAAGAVHVSLERDMRCGTAKCGHCQLGPLFVCREGPVVPWTLAGPLLATRDR